MKELLAKIYQKLYRMSFPRRILTGASDNQAYPQVCTQAALSYKVFNNFRRNPVYTEILEHVTQELGEKYLELILKDSEIVGAMGRFKLNDSYGNPKIYEYPEVGMVSPTTLRYIKVLCDLKKYFQTLDDLSICEIGIGYGGQCRIINAYYKPSAYCLVDIQPALSLAQRFLDNFILPSVITYKTMNALEKKNYDLCISNYAFTELPRSIQDVYLTKVILNSSRGYITYNEMLLEGFNSYKADELAELIPGAEIIKEDPLTHPKNCILLWGNDR